MYPSALEIRQAVTPAQQQSQSLARILHLSAISRRQELNSILYERLGGTVETGPFAGMKLLREASWGDGDLSPKLLGCYEAELHTIIRKFVANKASLIVNIGAAEGYYAVGLAMLLPTTQVYAFDTNQEAQLLCRKAALLNSVADRVSVEGLCDRDTLAHLLAKHSNAQLLVDCEGGELELLNPERLPALHFCDIIVECHDFANRSITATLASRFSMSHQLHYISEGGRNPSQHPSLHSFSSLDRWLAVCEFRPEMMHWIVACRR